MIKVVSIAFFLLVGFTSSAAGPWFQKADFPGVARHRTTSFAIGTMGYLGLGHINSAVDEEYEDFWKFDPSSNSWTQVADYPEGKMYHAAVFVIGTKAYVGTGRYENGTYSNKFHAYDAITNTWSAIANFIGSARRGAVGFEINGKGYIGTGQITGGYTSTFYEYDPTINQWSVKMNVPGPTRTSSVGFSIANFGYIGTGETFSGSVNDFYQYNPISDQWIMKAPVGPITRQEAVGFALNGKGYIGTGVDFSSGNNFQDFWEYDPNLDVWDQKDDFAGTARRYLSAFTIGSRAYMGTGTNGTNFQDFWMFDPALSGISEVLKAVEFSIYPNPASDYLSVEMQEIPTSIQAEKLLFKLYDLKGKEVKNEHFGNEKMNLWVGELPRSTYIYSLVYEGKELRNGKLILGK